MVAQWQPRKAKPRANKGPSLTRILPIVLLAGFSLYGLWFVPAAWSVKASNEQRSAPARRMDDVAAPVDAAAPAVVAAAAAAQQGEDEPPLQQQPPVVAMQQQPAAKSTPASAAAPASGACDATSAKPPGPYVGGFNGVQFAELVGEGADLERREMSISAWVRWEGGEAGDVASMQTIVANKASGCEANDEHQGLAVFINEWNTDSAQLYLSWGNRRSGCEELSTARNSLPPDTWAFITAVLVADGARLYINGKLMADTAQPSLGARRIQAHAPGGDDGRPMAPRRPMRVGMHPDGTHPLVGQIDELKVWPRALSEDELLTLMCGKALAATAPAALVHLSFEASGGNARMIALEPSFDVRAGDGDVGGGGGGGRDGPSPFVLRSGEASQAPSRLKLETLVKRSKKRRGRDKAFAGIDDSAASSSVPKGEWPLAWITAEAWNERVRPTAAEVNASDALAVARKEQVRNVMRRAWYSYERYAFGADELKPLSNRSHNWLGLGATLVDCLDNLWIMGLKDEFRRAQAWVENHLHFDRASGISMFETVIRVLGGLLSAFELSKEQVFLRKAKELADKLMYAFEKHRTGLPCTTVSLNGRNQCSYPSWAGSAAILAEYGTMQLEFKYLAYHTGEQKYWDVVERIIKLVAGLSHPMGLYPTFINPSSGQWSSPKLTFGALADSFYEYLVKQWLFTSKTETWLRDLWDETMLGMAGHLVQRSTPSQFAYIADWTGSGYQHKMDHLACFAPAMLAFGAQDGRKHDAQYMALAEKLCETCMAMYTRTRTGLAPEYVTFSPGKDMQVPRGGAFNIGRPETAESLFVMWYYTRDPKYREWGWKIFEAFERHAFTYSGWGSHPDVDNPARKLDDKMESFVLAETVKYLYLLFDSDYPIPLEKYVLNTEAHPLGKIDKAMGA